MISNATCLADAGPRSAATISPTSGAMLSRSLNTGTTTESSGGVMAPFAGREWGGWGSGRVAEIVAAPVHHRWQAGFDRRAWFETESRFGPAGVGHGLDHVARLHRLVGLAGRAPG